MKVTIKDVAKFANVSTATVSMVINNKANRISDETKKIVMDAIGKLNYKPNFTARSLVSSQSHTIGLIVPEITNPFFAEFSRHLERHLQTLGYITFLCNSGEDLSLEEKYIDKLIGHSVDGIIIFGLTDKTKEKLPLLRKNKIPYLVLDNRNPLDKFSISADDYAGGIIAAKHLIKLNHEFFAFAGDVNGYYNIYQRFKGFSDTVKKIGGEIDIYNTPLTSDGGKKIALNIFNSRATAVFCSNDLIAVGIYEEAIKNKFKIPEDLSIIGYDDISFADILSPKLTTIKQPLEEMAQLAGDTLINMITDETFKFDEMKLAVTLSERESTIRCK